MASQSFGRSSGVYASIADAPFPGRNDWPLLIVDRTVNERQAALGCFDRDGACDRFSDLRGDLVFAGWIGDRAELCAALRLPPNIRDANLAMEALEHFGCEMPTAVFGEWSLARLARDGSLTLALAATRRDRLFYAIRGRRIAASPSLFELAAFEWVDSEIDETGLLCSFGNAAVRQAGAGRTMFRGIAEVAPGHLVVIAADGTVSRRGSVGPLTARPTFQGDFLDAVGAATDLLRQILREQLDRHKPAILLSGGLDSSLLASMVTEVTTPELMTSVTRPGGRAPDERQYAARVASRLNAELYGFHVAEHDNIYRPGHDVFFGANGAVRSNRVYLTDANQRLASSLGATCIVNGTYGEFSVTARSRGPTSNPLRVLARQCLAAVRSHGVRHEQRSHVALSARASALLPSSPDEQVARVDCVDPDLFGYVLGAEKVLKHPNLYHPRALRAVFPFRDPRLLRLFASFPRAFLSRDGGDRIFARTILKGRVPEDIRMRRSGLPASPEHLRLLQEHATAARKRLPVFRRVGVGELLDLDWLDRTLASVARRGPSGIREANRVQLTAINAEMLTWVRGG